MTSPLPTSNAANSVVVPLCLYSWDWPISPRRWAASDIPAPAPGSATFHRLTAHGIVRPHHVETDDLRCLGDEIRIVALPPGLAPGEVDLPRPQEAPDVLCIA